MKMAPAGSSSSSSSSSRWCPTPEQVMILEELYNRGVRTPNASQIQKITAHLSYYGNIQGKNVFYWFQNHKARDRQKLRKKLAKLQQQYQLQQNLMYPRTLYQQHDHYQLYHDHQTHLLLPFHHHFSNSNYYLPPQLSQGTTRARDQPETQRVVMKQNCGSPEDLPKDFSTETYGHDLLMFMEAGPSSTGFHCCRSRPLETLDLFPLTSQPKVDHEETTSS